MIIPARLPGVAPRRLARCGALLAVLAGLSAHIDAAAQTAPDDQVKAGYLLSFVRFVSWPDSGHHAPDGPIVDLCVLQEDAGAAFAEPLLNGRRVGERTLRVIRGQPAEAWRDCYVVFISSRAADRAPSVFALVAGSAVLTVHEHRAPLRNGVIRLFLQNERLRFEINRAAAKRANLTISSRLLDLAEVVGE